MYQIDIQKGYLSFYRKDGDKSQNADITFFVIDDEYTSTAEIADDYQGCDHQHERLAFMMRENLPSGADCVGRAPWALIKYPRAKIIHSGRFPTSRARFWALDVLDAQADGPGKSIFLIDHFHGRSNTNLALRTAELLVDAAVEAKLIFSYSFAPQPDVISALMRFGIPKNNVIEKTLLDSDPMTVWENAFEKSL